MMANLKGEDAVALLKACAKERNLNLGLRLHADILKRGLLGTDINVGTTLISMYVRCGALAKARQVFEELPVQNVACWNALIAGYAQHGCGEEVLKCFECMQHEGLSPNAVTFASVVKACGSIGAVDKANDIHAQIVKEGILEKNGFLGNALIDMHAKCGALMKARRVFDELPVQDVVSWTVLIAGYVQHGQSNDALSCFERMQCEGITPNAITFACIVKACGNIGAADKGQVIHTEIAKKGLLARNVLLGTALVDMYAKCGALAKAQRVFDELHTRDVVTWTAIITGYTQHGCSEEALYNFEHMQHEGVSPNPVTFACVVKACGNLGAAEKGEKVHAEVVRKGMLKNNIALGTALVDMYAKCGELAKALQVFDELPFRNIVSWNALIAGYVQHGHNEEALNCFEWVKREGLSPDAVTFACIVKACSNLKETDRGMELHAEIVREGMPENNVLLGTALVDMYTKCGALAKAQHLFDKLPVRDVISWNAIIAGYIQHGHGEEALNCFGQMQREGTCGDVLTFASIVKALGSIGALDKGKEMHAYFVREWMLEKHVVLGNALVEMYAKCGTVAKAQELFDELSARDVVTWNALISGYAEHGYGEEALKGFEVMQWEGFSPDVVTFASVVKACSSIGAADKGKELYNEAVRVGMLQENIMLSTAFIDMYAKSGALIEAQNVFDDLCARDVFSWTALIAGYAEFGKCDTVFGLFDRMLREDIMPDLLTFTAVFNACSHSGLLDRGQMYYALMRTSYGIIPTVEHYTCMVNLFSRAGNFDKALRVISQMPTTDHLQLWSTLLGACQKWGNVKLGRLAFQHVVRLDDKFDAAYFCLSNIYAVAGMQEDAHLLEL